jgi:hypothetical protein
MNIETITFNKEKIDNNRIEIQNVFYFLILA